MEGQEGAVGQAVTLSLAGALCTNRYIITIDAPLRDLTRNPQMKAIVDRDWLTNGLHPVKNVNLFFRQFQMMLRRAMSGAALDQMRRALNAIE